MKNPSGASTETAGAAAIGDLKRKLELFVSLFYSNVYVHTIPYHIVLGTFVDLTIVLLAANKSQASRQRVEASFNQ